MLCPKDANQRVRKAARTYLFEMHSRLGRGIITRGTAPLVVPLKRLSGIDVPIERTEHLGQRLLPLDQGPAGCRRRSAEKLLTLVECIP